MKKNFFLIVIFFYALAWRLMCVETQTFHSDIQKSIEYTAICEREVVCTDFTEE